MRLAFQIVAIVLFTLAAIPPTESHWSKLNSIGLAFLTASFIVV